MCEVGLENAKFSQKSFKIAKRNDQNVQKSKIVRKIALKCSLRPMAFIKNKTGIQIVETLEVRLGDKITASQYFSLTKFMSKF